MTPFDTLVAERAKLGPIPTPEQLGALLNAVAWAHRAEGWGLSRKPSGHNVPAPDGTPIASDILHNRNDNTIVDCLIAAGERSEPTWNVLGPMTDPARPWVAPIDPGVPAPIDPPRPPDPPAEPPRECDLCAACLEVLKAQSASANEQRQVMIQMLAKLTTYEELRALVTETRDYYIKNPPIVKVRF